MKDSFCNPYFYEKKLVSKYGKDLSNMQLGDSFDIENKKLVSFFKPNGWWDSNKMRDVISSKNFNDCSMKLDSISELEEHKENLSEILYLHYGLGKENLLEGRFPSYACGRSTRNVCFSLMDLGYDNASCLIYEDPSFGFNHAVVALPFSIGKENAILIGDPTSDQFLSKRNLVGILGDDARYVSFDGSKKIIPERYLSASTIKEYIPSIHASSKNVGGFLKRAFSNQVKLNVKF